MNQDQSLPKMPSVGTAYLFIALATLLGALSGAFGSFVLFDMLAAALLSVALLSIKRPTIARMLGFAFGSALLSTAAAVGIGFLLYRRFVPAAMTAVSYAVCGAVIAVCVFKLRSRSLTVLLSGIVIFLTALAAFLCMIYENYNGIGIAAFKEFASVVKTAFRESLESYIRLLPSSTVTAEFTPAEIERLVTESLRNYVLLLPAAVFDLSMLAAFIITGIFRRILIGFYFGRRNLSNWFVTLSKPTGTVYLITIGGYMVLSVVMLFSESNVVTILSAALTNILILTLPACLCVGLRAQFLQLRRAPAQMLISLTLLFVIGCCNPTFLLFYFGFVGAFNTVLLPRIQDRMNNSNRNPPFGGPPNGV